MSGAGHLIDVGRTSFERGPDSDAMVLGRDNRPADALSFARLRGPTAGLERFQPLEQRLAHQWVAEVNAGAVAALCSEEFARQDDLRVSLRLQTLKLGDG